MRRIAAKSGFKQMSKIVIKKETFTSKTLKTVINKWTFTSKLDSKQQMGIYQ